jgi:REP element-mobilizing transposase RayT
VYGYVVMPEHVHLLLSEPEIGSLADALHYLKLSFPKRLRENWALQCRWNRQLSEPLGATSMIAQHAAVGGVLGCAEKRTRVPRGDTTGLAPLNP